MAMKASSTSASFHASQAVMLSQFREEEEEVQQLDVTMCGSKSLHVPWCSQWL